MPEEATGALDIDHADFEWLRAYLQREESRAHANAENEAGDEADEEDSTQQGGAKRQKFALPLMPLAPTEPLIGQRSISGNLSGRTISGNLSNGSGPYDALDTDVLEPDGRRRKVGWTSTEDLAILAIFRRLGTQWSVIAAQLPGRTPDAVRNRWHRLQKTHSLGDTEEGRAALDALLLACGIAKDWAPPAAPDAPPTVDQCIKGSDHGRAMWTAQEDTLIEEGVRRFGCKWREIAKSLPGRSDSSVRNRWMRLQRDRAAARGVDEVVAALPAAAAAAVPTAVAAVPAAPGGVPPPAAVAMAVTAVPAPPLPSVPEAADAAMAAPEAPAARPAALPLLKRAHSSVPGVKASPLGFGSPMLGFDLMSFVDAVSGAVEEDRATPMLNKLTGDALTFEETLLPLTRASSSKASWSSRGAEGGNPLDKEALGSCKEVPADEVAQPTTTIPAGLGLLSALLTGFAALTVAASIKAAASTRAR